LKIINFQYTLLLTIYNYTAFQPPKSFLKVACFIFFICQAKYGTGYFWVLAGRRDDIDDPGKYLLQGQIVFFYLSGKAPKDSLVFLSVHYLYSYLLTGSN